ncbi:methionyl-tRNA formyltransferase [Candidatus Pelagibacter sp.]|nr:methionyl-tRNA formyltransferase [Candidatus Pelagibacter sp.]
MAKIIFFGTPEFALPILRKINNSKHEILLVYTQSPKKSQRGQKINKSVIHEFSEKNSLNVKTPEHLESEEIFLKTNSFDLGIVVAYGKLIPKKILDFPKYGFINIHASLLPKYRGAAPIQRSLINRDKETGISFMKIIERLDAGPVCKKYKIQINENENYNSILTRLSNLGEDNVIEIIEKIIENKIEFVDQNENEATYAKKIEKIDGKIDWNESAELIQAKINALNPNPGGWFVFNNERYKILRSDISLKYGQPGEVLNEDFIVGCGNKSLKIVEIQRQGKKPQNFKEFLLGSKIKPGTKLSNV